MAQVLPSSISPGISALADAIAGYGANRAAANMRQAQMENMQRDDERAQQQLAIQRDQANLALQRFEWEQANQRLTEGRAAEKFPLELEGLDLGNQKAEVDLATAQTAKALEDTRIESLFPTAGTLTDSVVSNVERKMPEFDIGHLLKQGGSALPPETTLPGAAEYDTGMDYGGYGSTAGMDLIQERDQFRQDVRDRVGVLATNEVLSNKDLDAAKWIDDQTKTFSVGAGAPGAGDTLIKDPFSITKEFNSDKQYQAAQVGTATLNSMYKSFTDPSAISDYDFINGVAKILDPTSVVRTQEGDQVVATQALPSMLAGRLNQILQGEAVLDMKTRADLYRLAERRVDELQEQGNQQRDFYGNIATQNGYDPATFIPELPAMPEGSIGYMQDQPQQPSWWTRQLGGQPAPAATSPPADASRYPAPTPAAIAELRSDPSAAAEFDQTFGPGAAALVLGAQ
jgi:hypothetical protein